jgi:DNA-directed DNA polymerase III PolC
MGFVHLHCHSAYSLFEGTATPQTLISMAKRLKMPALALTDRNNLYGAIHFYTLAQKAGIKPITGMDVELDDGSNLVLLARNFDGYKNLCHLATVLRLKSDPEAFPPAGFDEDEEIPPWEDGVWGVPVFGFTPKIAPISISRPPKEARLPRELILSGRHVRGLIALSGGQRGLVNSLVMRGKTQSAARAAGMLLSAFGEGNFFIELQATCEGDRQALPSLVALANNLNIPIVATNNVLYARPEDRATAQALAAAHNGARVHRAQDMGLEVEEGATDFPSSREDVGSERYFRSDEEMAQLFSDYPQALANSHFLAEQCNVELPIGKPLFPSVEIPSNETPYSRLWKLCFAGATRRYRPLVGPVIARLKYELEVIDRLGFCPYFLVVHDIVRFAHSRDIPIMARGSAANSLVAYVLGITQIDPLQHDLLFERFLNPSRAEFEMPDIDLDLCWRRRDEVLHYVYERFGRDHAGIVGTYITFRQRSAWREMSRALGISAERINRVASRLHHAVSPEEALDGSDDLPVLRGIVEAPLEGQDDYDSTSAGANLDTLSQKLKDSKEREALQLCKAIEGLPRHAGMHCGGVVITPGPIADLIPLQRAARDPTLAITQYDKDAIEAMGLVKMDLLGSRALTALVDALHASGLAQGKGDVQRSLDAIPFDDPATYRMMAEGETLGCFQLESPGLRSLLKWLRPRSLNDIAIAISLFRPGPLEGGFLETFMRRRLGQEPVTYHHPSMQPILEETSGIILYQEQFLRLAHDLAGLDLGDAEKLRKDLGKTRSPEERARLGSLFVAGAIERGIDQLQAERVWEIVAGYTGFGFCKAHACSYALTAYRSGYVKAHYPAEFLASVVNNGGGYYGPSVYLEDARRLRVELLPPDANSSGAWCEVPTGTRSIRLGLQFLKGFSERTIAALTLERRSRGRFHSLPDLMSRVEMKPAEVEALVKVGGCDNLGADANMPRITAFEGGLGDAEAAAYMPALTRKQMMWLLPSLLSVRKSKARGTFYRARANADVDSIRLSMQATGSDGLSMQMMMSDLVQGSSDSPKILGSHLQHLSVPSIGEYSLAEKLHLEREVVGFAVSRNEMELYGDHLAEEGVVRSCELAKHAGREVRVAGVVVAGRRHTTKDGNPMLFISLQDVDGLVEVVLFSEAYKAHGEVLANGGYGPYVVRGLVQVSGKGRAIGIQPSPDLRPTDAASIKMHPVVICNEVRLLIRT